MIYFLWIVCMVGACMFAVGLDAEITARRDMAIINRLANKARRELWRYAMAPAMQHPIYCRNVVRTMPVTPIRAAICRAAYRQALGGN